MIERLAKTRFYSDCPKHGKFEVDCNKMYGGVVLGKWIRYTLCPVVVAQEERMPYGEKKMFDIECWEKTPIRIIKLKKTRKDDQNCDGRCTGGKYSCNCSCMGRCHGQGFCSCGKNAMAEATK